MKKGIRIIFFVLLFLIGFFYKPSTVNAKLVNGFSCVYKSVHNSDRTIQISFIEGRIDSEIISNFEFETDSFPPIKYAENSETTEFSILNDSVIFEDCPKYLFDISKYSNSFGSNTYGCVGSKKTKYFLLFNFPPASSEKVGDAWVSADIYTLPNGIKIESLSECDTNFENNGGKLNFTKNTITGKREYNYMNIGGEPIEFICGGENGVINDPFLSFLNKYVFTPIKYVMPILLVIFTAIDFIKVVFTGDSKSMDKAWSNLIKRIVMLLCLFLITEIVNLVLKLFIGSWTDIPITSCNITTYH